MRWKTLQVIVGLSVASISLNCFHLLPAFAGSAHAQPIIRKQRVIGAEQSRIEFRRQQSSSQDSSSQSSQESLDERRRLMLEQELEGAGISPNPESIRSFLMSLVPSDEDRARIENLIHQLDSNSYHEREAATRELITIPSLQVDDLSSIQDSSDDETRWRVTTILKARNEGVVQRNVLYAVEYIGLADLRDMVEPLECVVETVDRSLCADRVARALAVTIGDASPNALEPWLHHENASQRLIAFKAFIILCRSEQVDHGEAVSEETPPGPFTTALPEVLMQLANDSDSQIRLQVAEELARARDRRALSVLLVLMEERQRGISDQAAGLLRSLTGQSFGFSTYSEDEQRDASLEQWRQWVADHGASAELREIGLRHYLGRTLIATYSANRFLEIDRSGQVIWEVRLDNPFACQGLENGHRIVALYPRGIVIEFDVEGKEIWRAEGLPGSITGIDRLPNGNTLIAAGQSGNLIVEIDPAKNRVWEQTIEGSPVHATRLPNGRTMVCLMTSKKIVEIDREGKILWSIDTGESGYFAQRLENGNTLVRFSKGGAAEFRPDGTIIREFKSEKGYTAQRLPDGTTLVADSGGLKLFDPDGNVIEENKDFSGYLYVNYY